jgi:ABC-2 type transport system permease protein
MGSGRIGAIDGVSYAAFIVPGLMMLTVVTESLKNAAFGIHMPKFIGTIYELLSAPISPLETVLAFVGAAATKSVILATARLFIPLQVLHPLWMASYLVLVALAFSLAGFITISLFNPVMYVISGFRWSFYGSGDVAIGVSVAALLGFLMLCFGVVWWIFRTGYRLKS